VVLYAVRAVQGLTGGSSYVRGAELAADGYYYEALPLLERGAVGEHGFEAEWLAAEVRLGIWDLLTASGERGTEHLAILREAADGYRRAARLSPASGWPWSGIGKVYERVELADRSMRTIPLDALGSGPWALVGTEGRMSIGLGRIAMEKEPNVAEFHDELVLRLVRFGLLDEAADAIRTAALVLPVLGFHDALREEDLSDELLRAFLEGAKETEGTSPLLSDERYYFAMGKLHRRLGDREDAERYFRRALESPAAPLERAETRYHLGLVLMDLQRFEEAEDFLAQAERQEVFAGPVLSARAAIAEQTGDLRASLGFLQQAVRESPRDLALAVRYARLARELGERDMAFEALRWMTVVHPRNSIPWIELVETHLAFDERATARTVVREASRVLGEDTPALVRLDERIEGLLAERGP
jgi:tetratricopeptide (TPR) repeat protein